MSFTKLNQADLDFPCRELSNSGPGNAVALPFFQEVIFCVGALGVHFSCNVTFCRFVLILFSNTLDIVPRSLGRCKSLVRGVEPTTVPTTAGHGHMTSSA